MIVFFPRSNKRGGGGKRPIRRNLHVYTYACSHTALYISRMMYNVYIIICKYIFICSTWFRLYVCVGVCAFNHRKSIVRVYCKDDRFVAVVVTLYTHLIYIHKCVYNTRSTDLRARYIT